MDTVNEATIASRWQRPSLLSIGALLVALPIGLPILAILWSLTSPTDAVWLHLRETVLMEYVASTVLLLAGVGVLVLILGVGTAWLTATRSFPGQQLFRWALILPFAAPAYVIAYAYADLLSFAGPVQSFLREVAGFSELRLPPVRSLPGAIIVLGLVLYPYVYLLAFNAFAEQARPLMEAARVLGANERRAFFAVVLPHARPAIAAGLALALMETAADFGVVEFYGVPTLTTGIFRTWFAQGERLAATQLAGILFLVVALLVLGEGFARRGSHANPLSRNVSPNLIVLTGGARYLATAFCAVPLLLGFIVPIGTLFEQATTVGDPLFGVSFLSFVNNTVTVAVLASILAVSAGLWLAYAARAATLAQRRWSLTPVAVRIATLGYAVPGLVLAVGLMGPLTTLDRQFASTLNAWTDQRVGLLLTGTVLALLCVYLARFLTVAFNGCESALARVHPRLDAAGRSLGSGPLTLLRRVHLPLVLPGALSAALLVFIDVAKELPATLIMRPFNFETLATRAYRLAADERLAEASTAALCIVVVGLLPTLLLAQQLLMRRR